VDLVTNLHKSESNCPAKSDLIRVQVWDRVYLQVWVIDWKDSLSDTTTCERIDGDVKPYSPTHSLALLRTLTLGFGRSLMPDRTVAPAMQAAGVPPEPRGAALKYFFQHKTVACFLKFLLLLDHNTGPFGPCTRRMASINSRQWRVKEVRATPSPDWYRLSTELVS